MDTKPVTKEEYIRLWNEGMLSWLKEHEPDYYKDLYAVTYNKVRPSKPVTAEEWDRLWRAGLLVALRREDSDYWRSLFAAKYGKLPDHSPEQPAAAGLIPGLILGAGVEMDPAANEFYTLSIEDMLQAVKSDPQGFLNKFRARFKPADFQKLFRMAQDLLRGAKTEGDFSKFVTSLINAARETDPRNPSTASRDPYQLAMKDKVRPAGPKNPPRFKPDGPNKYYNGGQPTVKKDDEFPNEVLWREYARLEVSGELDALKKSDPKYYLKLLKAWADPENSWKPPKGAR